MSLNLPALMSLREEHGEFDSVHADGLRVDLTPWPDGGVLEAAREIHR